MNAKNELSKKMNMYKKAVSDIAYMAIYYEPYTSDNTPRSYMYKDGDIFNFGALDFEYDSGYGVQELFGFVVFKDGSWLERHEYDGSEHWKYINGAPSLEAVMAIIPK